MLSLLRRGRALFVSGDGDVDSLDLIAQDVGLVADVSAALNLHSFDYFVVLVSRFDPGHMTGNLSLNSVLGIIPRFIWKDKPEIINPGVWYKNFFYGGTDSGMPFTSMGVWWIDLGFLGVAIYILCTAFFYLLLWRLYNNQNVVLVFFSVCLTLKVFVTGFSAMLPIQLINFLILLFPFCFFLKVRTR
jgi:hypothetical protein